MAHERNLFHLSDDEKENIYSIIRNISDTPYYDKNQYHSLSHIQKVILFAGILAKNENLSLEETNILLAAAAFHDSGRDGAEGEEDHHAMLSAKQVKKYLEGHLNNPFGITYENISMIQAVIEYHEHKEQEKGMTDREKLQELSYQYDIDYEKFFSLVKISELLKDADALDRARFGKKNENRWSLDAKYLKSETAKSISMLRFSEDCNKKMKENGEMVTTLSENMVEKLFDEELNEFNRPKVQMSSIKQMTSGIESAKMNEMMNDLIEIQRAVVKDSEEINR